MNLIKRGVRKVCFVVILLSMIFGILWVAVGSLLMSPALAAGWIDERLRGSK